MLHIITRFILGGAQENTLLSVLGLRRYPRWEITLATGPAAGPEGSLLQRARREGLEPLILSNLQREISPWKDITAYSELCRLIRRLCPHVVHTHSSKGGILGRLAASHCGVPVIVHTIHGPSFHPNEKAWRNSLFIGLERWTARRTTSLVCVADAMAQEYLAEGVGKKEQYVTIRSGMEVEPFVSNGSERKALRDKLGIPEKAFVFAKVSRIAPLKGHEDVLRAAAEIRDKAPSLHLLFVGDGSLTEKIRRMADGMDLSDRLTLTGLVPAEKVPALLHASDALVHASYREGLPRAVVQAGLAALPVVASSVDGTPEAVEEGVTGYLVEAGDHHALARRMLDICKRPEEARAMGARARKRLKEEFDWNRMVEELDGLYVKLLAGKGLWEGMLDINSGDR